MSKLKNNMKKSCQRVSLRNMKRNEKRSELKTRIMFTLSGITNNNSGILKYFSEMSRIGSICTKKTHQLEIKDAKPFFNVKEAKKDVVPVVKEGKFLLLEHLHTYGTQLSFTYKKTCDLLAIAIREKHSAIIVYLLKEAIDFNSTKDFLELAVKKAQGKTQIVKLLLQETQKFKAETTFSHFNREKALLAAVVDCKVSTINSDSFIVDQQENYEDNPNQSVIQLLLQHKVNINTSDRQGNTPLLKAVQNANIEITQLLLTKGAFVHAKNDQGATPLLAAVYVKDVPLIELLLQHKADPNKKNCKNQTAASLAKNNKTEKGRDILKLLYHYSQVFTINVHDHQYKIHRFLTEKPFLLQNTAFMTNLAMVYVKADKINLFINLIERYPSADEIEKMLLQQEKITKNSRIYAALSNRSLYSVASFSLPYLLKPR